MFPSSGVSRAFRRLCAVVFAVAATTCIASAQTTPSTTVVISEVYGGGGSTSTAGLYPQDFVELFNMSSAAVDISGWSVQYVAATATTTTAVSASNIASVPSGVSLAPGQRYLIAGTYSASYGSQNPLPTADVTGSFAAAAGAGHFFLVKSSTAVSPLACPESDPNVVDNVAYGLSSTAALCGAGGAGDTAPTLTSSLIAIRTNACTNTGKNASDFSTGTTAPRASTATATPCGATVTAPSLSSPTASPATVTAGGALTVSVTVTPGSGTISTVTADLSPIGGSSTQALTNTSGSVWSYQTTVPSSTAAATYTVNFKATDSNSQTATASTTYTVQSATVSNPITLSNGTATPSSVTAGSTTLLTVAATAATNPTSTSLAVVGNLSAFGGSTTQAFYDDGTHGDKTSGDGIYSYSLAVPSGTAAANYTIALTASDSQARTASGSIALTIQPPAVVSANVALYTNTTTAAVGSAVTFTAVVTAVNSSATPTGTVNFYDGGKLLGAGTASTGAWYYTTSALAAGSHVITIAYSGDSTFPSTTTSTPASVTVTVTTTPVADFNLILSNSALTASGAQRTQTMTVAVQGVTGFSDTVALSCSGLPAGSRCQFSPTSITGSGTSVLTIAVDGASLRHTSPFGKRGSETALAFGLLALPLAFRRRMRAKLARVTTLAAILGFGMMLTGVMTGCGDGNSTPSGTSTVTVTAKSSTATKTATFQLNVQ
nr:Ig-like domain repeat protein [Granulicella cerasi]